MGTAERKARERMQREEMILDVAERVFFSQGFENSTMDDIASGAELSKGSLYNYFKNKNELCIGIVLRSLRLLEKSIEAAVTAEVVGLEKIRHAALAYQQFQRENPEYYCALQNYRHHRGGCGAESKFLSQTLAENRHINELLAAAIELGIADGSVKQDIDSEQAAAAIWGEMNGLLPGFDLNASSAGAYNYAVRIIVGGIAADLISK